MTGLAIRNELLSPRSMRSETRAVWTAPAAGKLTLDRHDIVFAGFGETGVRFEITLRNRGDAPTTATTATVSVAPFGAFVTWTPLLTMPIDTVAPRATTILRSEVERAGPGSLPELYRMTALKRLAFRCVGLHVPRQEPHVSWAGNLDLFVHEHSVERHAAQFPGLVPGTTNVVDFVIGSDRADSYMFDVAGDLKGATIELQSGSFRHRRIMALSTWTEFPRQRTVWLLAKTSPRQTEGSLQIQVRQRSSGREAVVEFGFGNIPGSV